MRIAINGYFWDQPRTGSGQYTRHLRCALSELISGLPDKKDHRLALLQPGTRPVANDADRRSLTEQSKIQSLPSSGAKGPKSKIGKAVWKQWDALRQARRVRADLLHVPYLA